MLASYGTLRLLYKIEGEKHLRGTFNLILIMLHTVFWCTLLFILFVLQSLNKTPAWQITCQRGMSWLGEHWIQTNNWIMTHRLNIAWDLPTLQHVSQNDWYFIIANHQSWSDILILQKIFVGKIPFIRFFIKKALLWLPILNIAWFAFDFPIMQRYSKKQLAERPELRRQDLETTRKACEKYQTLPITLLNFVEGTRFTEKKRQQQHSPYRHLLLPKPGGLAFAIQAMNGKIRHILDVTLIYPDGRKSFFAFLSGKVKRVTVKVQQREIPDHLLVGDYQEDDHYRKAFKAWLQALWKEKDQLLNTELV